MSELFISRERKEVAAVVSAVLCLAFAPLSYEMDSIYHIELIWSLIFIMPAVLTLETGYAALTGGCCCAALPFIVHGSSMETASFAALRYILLFLWILYANICERYILRKKHSAYVNTYTLHAAFFAAAALIFLMLEVFAAKLPFGDVLFDGMSPSYRRVSLVNSILTDLMLLTMGKLLLELPSVRHWIGLSEYPCSGGSRKIFLYGVVFSSLFIMADVFFDSIYFNTYGFHSSFIKITNGVGIKLSVIILITATVCRYLMLYKRTMLESYTRIRSNEEKLRAIFMNMSDMYFEIGNFGIITDISYSVKRNLSVDRQSLIGVNIRSICRGGIVMEKLRKMRINEDLLNQETEFHFGGKMLYVLIDIHKAACSRKNDEKYMIFARDITEIRNDELEIRALNKQLESTVIERTDQLSKAYSDLESFSYTVSHELKTPIREIETYIEFIGEDNADVLNEQSLKDIESIKNVCTNTMHLIQSMMEYSRVGYKALNNEYVDMNSVITECFSEIMKPVHDRKVKLETGDIPQIYGDKFLIKQLVFNIISNSVKFTKEKEEAVISVTADPSEDTVTLYFRDNGVGFEPNSNVHLFNVFDRMHNESDYEGSGIGLATVKKIVKRFNGKVTIEGWPNKGCCVTVQLPANNMIQSFEN